jgi:hypothetical protein
MRGELLYPPLLLLLLILGDHADWQFAFYFPIYRVYGAADPNSGMAALFEVARGRVGHRFVPLPIVMVRRRVELVGKCGLG